MLDYGRLILCFFVGLLVANGAVAVEKREEVYKRVGDAELKIHIFEPNGHSGDDKRPAIVFFFGGGWTSGSRKQFFPHCTYLAERGMVAMAADYRVKSRHNVKAVSCVEDGKSAVRWIRANAERLGVDPNRVAAGGGSAGGHVAACTGLIDEFDSDSENKDISSVPNLLVLFNPVLVLAPFGSIAVAEARIERFQDRMGVEPERLSPAHHIDGDTPATIVFHGTEDSTVPFVTIEAFKAAMDRAGNECVVDATQGAGHGFFNFNRAGHKAFNETVAQMDAFLVEHGFLEGPARGVEDVARFSERGAD